VAKRAPSIAIGRAACGEDPMLTTLPGRHRLGLWCPPTCGPESTQLSLQEPFTRRLVQLNGTAHEVALWVPGPRPVASHWWEEISMWWVLRPVLILSTI
jgi:hypothetical protein